MFESVNQVLGVEFQFLQTYLLELFILGEIRLLNQLVQPLSVATVFCVQAINFFTQRGILYFIHQAPPHFKEHLHIALFCGKGQARRIPKMNKTVDFWGKNHNMALKSSR